MDQIKEFKIKNHQALGEFHFLKQVNESQDKKKNENTQKISILESNIKEAEIMNKKFKQILTHAKLEKDSTYRALMIITKQNDISIFEEIDKLYQSYNNQYFLAKFKPVDEDEIENYLCKISLLEKEIKIKNSEILSLTKLVVHDNKNFSKKETIEKKISDSKNELKKLNVKSKDNK